MSRISRIFLNGDSITYGLWDDEAGGWGNRLKTHMIRAGRENEVINLALRNQTLDVILQRLPVQLPTYGHARSLGVFMLGAADSLIRSGQDDPQNPIEQFTKQLPQLGNVLAKNRVTPMFVGLYPLDDSHPSPIVTEGRASTARGMAYDAAVRGYAAEIGAPYVDIDAAWDNPAKLISFDGIHPNPEGHKIIATTVSSAVQLRLAAPLLSYTRRTLPG